MTFLRQNAATPNTFGFAAVADVVAGDADQQLFIFRRFGKLAARSLLDMQNELAYLGHQQENLDHEVEFSGDPVLCKSMMNYNELKEILKTHEGLQIRQDLQDKISLKLTKYHQALLLQCDLARLEQPTRLALKTYREVIFDQEQDLVALNDSLDTDTLSNFIRVYWPFNGQEVQHHEKARSFGERSLVFLVRFCSTAISVAFFICSILALYFARNPDLRLSLVIAFVVLFAIGLTICTGATRDSIFAGTAAYAAVLIVFVSGNLSNVTAGVPGP